MYQIYTVLKEKKYKIGKFNRFKIYEPKEREIVSFNMFDKVVNNLVSKYILEKSLSKGLVDVNVASRKNKGISKGLLYRYEYEKKLKHLKYYVLKCDISKFFNSIDINILKEKIKRKIKDKDALNILNEILSCDKHLPIGLNTSQILAIFYLDDLDKYIKEKLKIKYYVRFQDDFLMFHSSKLYLQNCIKSLEVFLSLYMLKLNKKTRIYNFNNNYMFLGRNKYGKYNNYRLINRKIKKRYKLYTLDKINVYGFIISCVCFDKLNSNIHKLVVN